MARLREDFFALAAGAGGVLVATLVVAE